MLETTQAIETLYIPTTKPEGVPINAEALALDITRQLVSELLQSSKAERKQIQLVQNMSTEECVELIKKMLFEEGGMAQLEAVLKFGKIKKTLEDIVIDLLGTGASTLALILLLDITGILTLITPMEEIIRSINITSIEFIAPLLPKDKTLLSLTYKGLIVYFLISAGINISSAEKEHEKKEHNARVDTFLEKLHTVEAEDGTQLLKEAQGLWKEKLVIRKKLRAIPWTTLSSPSVPG